MSHPHENTLGLYALHPEAVPDREGLERHLAMCEECPDHLAQIRAFDARLRNPDSWDERDDHSVRAAEELRTFALRAAVEDRAARELLAGFEDPECAGQFAWLNIAAKSEYRTGGVARRLCGLAFDMLQRKPLYALALAEAAVSISVSLAEKTYPRKSIHELRGEALKQKANALHQLGRLDEALSALASARLEYDQLPHAGLGLLAVDHIHAAILYEQEDFTAADRLAAETAAAALHLGDHERAMRAQYLRAEIAYERGLIAEAAELFSVVLMYGEQITDSLWIARGELSVGICYVELGRNDAATRCLHSALRRFSDLRLESYVTRTEWAIALLEFRGGNATPGIHRLQRAIGNLTRDGLLTDAAVAAVDLAEMLNAAHRHREIPKLLSGVVRTFVAAGKVTAALVALAELKDAAARGRLTPVLATHVRRFLVRVDRQPNLTFAPPPAPPQV